MGFGYPKPQPLGFSNMQRLTLSIFFLLAAQLTEASGLYCSGTVDKLSYHSPNKFMIKLNTMNTPVFFCNPSGTWTVSGATTYETSKESCNTMYSTFLAAKMSGKVISNMVFDGDGVPNDCGSWSTWQSANIRHYVLN